MTNDNKTTKRPIAANTITPATKIPTKTTNNVMTIAKQTTTTIRKYSLRMGVVFFISIICISNYIYLQHRIGKKLNSFTVAAFDAEIIKETFAPPKKQQQEEEDVDVTQTKEHSITTTTKSICEQILESQHPANTNNFIIEHNLTALWIGNTTTTPPPTTDGNTNSTNKKPHHNPNWWLYTCPISVVISHCDEDVRWIFKSYLKDFIRRGSVRDITIYSKCGRPVTGVPDHLLMNDEERRLLFKKKKNLPVVEIRNLTNVGRCDHSYAYWIANQTTTTTTASGSSSSSSSSAATMAETNDDDETPKKKKTNGIVIFLKGHDNRYRSRWPPSRAKYTWSHDDMIRIALRRGFACRESSLLAKKSNRVELYSVYHDVEFLRAWGHKGYNSGRRGKAGNDVTSFASEWESLGDWAERGLGLFNFSTMGYVPVCYGGIFVTTRGQLWHHAAAAASGNETLWELLERSLSRGDNIEEGHFAERMWGALLSKRLREEDERVFRTLVTRVMKARLANEPGLIMTNGDLIDNMTKSRLQKKDEVVEVN